MKKIFKKLVLCFICLTMALTIFTRPKFSYLSASELPLYDSTGNLLVNGDCSDGSKNWIFYGNKGDATFSIQDGAINCTVNKFTSRITITISQDNVPLEANKVYKISFWMKCSETVKYGKTATYTNANQEMQVRVFKNASTNLVMDNSYVEYILPSADGIFEKDQWKKVEGTLSTEGFESVMDQEKYLVRIHLGSGTVISGDTERKEADPPVEILLDNFVLREAVPVNNSNGLAVDTNQVFYPAGDSMVRSGNNSDKNFSLSAEFSVCHDINPDDTSKALISFDFSEFKGESTAFASLSLYSTTSGDGQTPSLDVYGFDDEYEGIDHLSVTWDTLPDKLTYIATCTAFKDTTRTITFNVTDFINANMEDKKVTFLIEAKGLPSFGQKLSFSSSKDIASRKPKLTLAFDQQPVVALDEVMQPIWKSDVVYNESVMMVSKDGNIPEASLLYNPTEIISVKNARMTCEYEEGKDWVLEDGKIKLTPDSRIAVTKYEEIYPAAEHPTIRTFESLTGGYILSPEGEWFHDRQIVVTYKHEAREWNSPLPEFAGELLPKTIERLQNGESLKIELIGDSISAGANASSRSAVSPYLPTWGELVAKQLRDVYNSEVTFVNPSLGGTTVTWGEQVASSYIATEKPDLLIIAFGMNGKDPANVFIKSIKNIMEKAKEANPDVEFIIVASMQPNSDWQTLELKEEYAEEIKKLEDEGVAIADMWSFHGELLNYKNYYDMTGNNVNHPNDFLIRCYAQVISALMIDYD